VVVLALCAAEEEDCPIFLHEHLAGSRFELVTTETAHMLFDHRLPPRHFLSFAFSLEEHDDIPLADRTHGVAGNDPSFIAAVKDAALDLHCLPVHAGRTDDLDYFRWRCIVCHDELLTPSAR